MEPTLAVRGLMEPTRAVGGARASCRERSMRRAPAPRP
jgi:hypothetical protein